MASSEGPGRDVAYLILGNYGGTMKGVGPTVFLAAFGSHCSCLLSPDEKLIFLLIVRKRPAENCKLVRAAIRSRRDSRETADDLLASFRSTTLCAREAVIKVFR